MMKERLHTILFKIQGISLTWKLLLPFLFFAFTGTTTMAWIGLTSQQKLIMEEENKEVLNHYHHFINEMKTKERLVLSLATMVSKNPEVQRLLAMRDRKGLMDLLKKAYDSLKDDFHISYFHFHIPPATSFLRLHCPGRHGEEMGSLRKTILDAVQTGRTIAGLELGLMGFGIRGVAPIKYKGKIIGSVETGLSFGEVFLKNIHETWNIDLAVYEIRGEDSYIPLAKANGGFKAFFFRDFLANLKLKKPAVFIAPENYPDKAILFGPVTDYAGKVVALLEISVDRSEIQNKLLQSRRLMIFVGCLGIVVSFLLTFLVASLFIKPIKEIVEEAQEIAQERREHRLEPKPNDEIGKLTQALNVMLDALRTRRKEVEKYAKDLEKRVEERTADLVTSMENYRTLVENVPLIVYRILPNGTTEFVNSYLTEILGYSIEEAVGDTSFWHEKICGVESEAYDQLMEVCFQEAQELRVERKVSDKEGRSLVFIDHAIPSEQENGTVAWIDGIMMDISELKRLQERALLTEEIKTLGEISARMAHEIRNPLATAGGFARRLLDSLSKEDPNHRLAQIIVDEAARMENFLKILFSSIRPFELSFTEVDINDLLRYWLIELKTSLSKKQIHVVEDLLAEPAVIEADEERLNQVFENLLKHAIVTMPEKGELLLSTRREGDKIIVRFRHGAATLSNDDIDQFFYPHIDDSKEWGTLDLPLSRIIIHRHGGKVEVDREGRDTILLKIEFPTKAMAERVE
jgi:PAS domain S-box-containing protein